MSLQMEKLEHNMAKITVEVSAEEFAAAVEKAYQKNKGKIEIQGFRKGKAPRNIIEKMYGKEVFYEDAANIILPDSWAKTYDECEEEIVSSPQIDVVQMEEGKPFIYTATVALNPEVTLGNYKGIEIDKVEAEVTDEDVENKIKEELERQASQVTVEGRPVQEGDTVILDFEGFVDGVAFEGGKGENYSLTIGSGAFIPGFEDQLIGKNAEEECDVNVTFPEDYNADELAGKAAVFKCKVHEIKEKKIPALDEDFADDAGFDSVDEYKADIKKQLVEKKEKDAKNAKEEAAIAAVVANSTMDIPDAMVETMQREMVNEFAQQLSMQGLSIEQYFQFTGMTKQMMMEQTKPRALERIQTRLVLDAIVKAENIEVTEEELDAELKDMAESYKMELDKLKDLVGEEEQKMIKKDLANKKALEVVVSNAVEK